MRPKQDKKLRRSKRHRSLTLPYMLRNFVHGDDRGEWQILAVRARVAVKSDSKKPRKRRWGQLGAGSPYSPC